MEKYNLSEVQAKSILAMRLSSLAKLEKIELENEKKELMDAIEKFNTLLQSKELQLSEIKSRLEEIVKKYGDARRTELAQIEVKADEKEIATVIPKDVVVVTSKSGLIKKIPVENFKPQKRGGKGVKTKDDVTMSAFKTNTVDTLMMFSNMGKMYRTVVDNVPDGTNATKGQPIKSFVKLAPSESIISITSLHRKSTPKYVVFITKMGMVKKTLLDEYLKTNRNTGIMALKLKDGDSLASVLFMDEEDLILITKNGMSIHFATKDIKPIGRVTLGVKGIALNDNDEVIAGLPIHKTTDTIGLFNTTGQGKKVKIDEFSLQNKGGKGICCYKTPVAGAAMLSDEDSILILGNTSSICISAKEVPLLSRTAEGNKMIKADRVLGITKI
jgi:DNA gyrase subunit A